MRGQAGRSTNRIFPLFTLVLVVGVFFIAFPLPGQEEELVERTICVLDPVDLSEEQSWNSETIKLLISDTIAVFLADKGYNVIDNASVREEASKAGLTGEALLDKERVIESAKGLGADVVINGSFVVEGGAILIGVKAYDIFTGRIATAVVKEGEAGFAIYDTVDETAELIAGKVRENLKPLPESVITVEREKVKIETKIVEEVISVGEDVEITFVSKDEGAEVYLGGEKLIATISGGSAEFTAKAETVLDLVIRKAGHHDREMSVELGVEKEREIELKRLYPAVRLDLSGYWTFTRPLGLNTVIRFHIVPDFLLLRGRVGVFHLPRSYQTGEEWLDITDGMLNTSGGLSLGWYPFISPMSLFRFMLFLGAASDQFYFSGDSVMVGAGLGLEWGIRFEFNLPRVSFFVTGMGTFQWPLTTAAYGRFYGLLMFDVGVGGTWKF